MSRLRRSCQPYLLVSLLRIGAVAFTTLIERKILGLTQYRIGPNKVSLGGLIQPVLDGLKLLTKDRFRPIVRQELLFFLSPALLIGLFILMWMIVIPWEGVIYSSKNISLLFFCCLAVMAYSVILAGWRSTSAFSKIGRIRGILQSLSYEVALILSFLWCLFLFSGFSFVSLDKITLELCLGWLVFIVMLVLIEGNRAPFDLLEGERELIRGFNIEIGRLIFVYLFLREYGIILFISFLLSVVLFSYLNTLIFVALLRVILVFRRCYPRVRYDSLIGLMWKRLLPFITLYVSWVVCLK